MTRLRRRHSVLGRARLERDHRDTTAAADVRRTDSHPPCRRSAGRRSRRSSDRVTPTSGQRTGPTRGSGDVDAWVEPVETASPRLRRARRRRRRSAAAAARRIVAAAVLMVPSPWPCETTARAASSEPPAPSPAPEHDDCCPDRSSPTAAPGTGAGCGEPGPAEQSSTAVARATAPPRMAIPVRSRAESRRRGDGGRAADEPACAGKYTVVAGDYWVRFAESSGADLDAWLNANGATAETPLYAGDVLCIPAGASGAGTPAIDDGWRRRRQRRRPRRRDSGGTTPPTDAPPTDAPTTTEPPTTAATDDRRAADRPRRRPIPVDPGSVEAIIRAGLARRARGPGARHRSAREQPAARRVQRVVLLRVVPDLLRRQPQFPRLARA